MSDRDCSVTDPLRVLVIDDEFLIADHIADILECAGHKVVGTAASGEQALHVLDREEIDLAVIDITLAGPMDGIELAQRLSSRGVTHVYVSGSGDAGTINRARATNPLAFLQKPFDETKLLSVLNDVRAGAAPQSGTEVP